MSLPKTLSEPLSLAGRRLSRWQAGGSGETLRGWLVGLEREGLRVAGNGKIAQTPHPAGLGSALMHPAITTDYSEALLELITPPSSRRGSLLECLQNLQTFVQGQLGQELIWASSMPCILDSPEHIPIAHYGLSNRGLMKTVYRRGLGHRYGRVMQVIAGIHFNFSLPDDFWPIFQTMEGNTQGSRDFISASYLGMMRNLQRLGWLIPYLFGASPAVCKTFLQGRATDLLPFDEGTYHHPYATSLRMGRIGYQNRLEEGVGIKACYDNLENYIASLARAIETPYPPYQAIGVVVNGGYEQLNANILQIENEYYSTVRPKQPPEGLEKPSLALARRGIRYIELRSLDVNPFEPLGVAEETLCFLEAFLIFCLLADSPRIGPEERQAIDLNQTLAAHQGREPALELAYVNGRVGLRDWGLGILDAMVPLCAYLDGWESADKPHQRVLAEMRARLKEPERTPSARVLAMMQSHDESYFEMTRRLSEQHRQFFKAQRLDPALEASFAQEAQTSMARQVALEASDTQPFSEFLADYFAQGRGGGS